MCPPCVGGNYHPNRACTLHDTCPMDHRANNALVSSRRTRGRTVPGGGPTHQTAHDEARVPITQERHERQHTSNATLQQNRFGAPGGTSPFGEFVTAPHQSITFVLPKATPLFWAYGSPYSLSCGRQVPDVGIPHYRDARMQHSPIQCPSTLHTG